MKLEIEVGPRAYRMHCPCGFITPWRWTLEAIGRDMDIHQAEKYPIGTERRPCPGPEAK